MSDYLQTDYQKKIFYDRYAQTKEDGTKETVEDMFRRLAHAAAKDCSVCGMTQEEQEETFFNMFANKEFIGAGRVLLNTGGTGSNATGNCYAVSVEDSLESIMKCQSDCVRIAAKGGGTGTNFSLLRPQNDPVQGAPSGTSGPLSFIDAREGYADTIRQGGSRRMAQMTILNCDHPDIFEFVTAKTDHKRWKNTNISVGILDSFMDAVCADDKWELKFNNKVYDTVSASRLWEEICRCSHASAEPGLLFLDTINDKFPLKYLYKISETNVCGEQPLPPYGMCLLGSLILSSFVRCGVFHFDDFKVAVRNAVIFLDSLIDITTFPIPEVKEMVLKTRPIGLGITGLADALFLMALPYGNYVDTLEFIEELCSCLYKTAVETSEELGKELGSFTDYDFDKATFPSRRNSTLLSFAPTGTISGFAGCSYGIEPYFAPAVVRQEDLGRDIVSNPIIDRYMCDNNLTEFPEWTRFVGGCDARYNLTIADHLEVLHVLSKHCDSSTSKTVNLHKDATVEDISDIYMYCWTNGIKGITVYRDGCRSDQPITWDNENEPEDLEDLEEEVIEFLDYTKSPKERPNVLEGRTYKVRPHPSEASIYITINDFEDSPFEIFFTTNNATHQEYLDGLSRAITALWRRGILGDFLFEDFCRYESPSGGTFYEYEPGKHKRLKSILDAIGTVVRRHIKLIGCEYNSPILPEITRELPAVVQMEGYMKCDECGEHGMNPNMPCPTCEFCGYSRCG